MPFIRRIPGGKASSGIGRASRQRTAKAQPFAAKPDFEEVYREFFPRVMRYAYSKTSNHAIAEDLTQEVLTACYRHYARFDPERASLATWVFVIARNRLKNYYRSRRIDESIDAKEGFDLPSGEALLEEAVAFEETRRLLKEELAQLTDRERAVLEGKYFHDKTSDELAAEFDMTAVNVRTVQKRAREKLKDALIARGYAR